ncbi:MAG: hypothetical protein QM757_23310, partial [Paludibaculum sp.]
GFAYRLDEKGRQLLRGGYGIFYSRTPSILTGTAMSLDNGVQVQTYTLSANLPTYPNILSAPPTVSRTPDIYVVSPNFVSPLTAQWNFNYEVQLSKDYAVTFGYLGLHGYHLSRTRDINLFPLFADTATYADGSPTVIYTRLANRPNATSAASACSTPARTPSTTAPSFRVRSGFPNFQLLASYTLSKVIDTVPDATTCGGQ